MANVEDLPTFFRGGVLERLLTTFQNQINQNYNFWAHDVIGARRAGKISNQQVAYKVLTSHILPALFIGTMSRGDIPRDWKDVLQDIVMYPVASIYLIGGLINRIIQGYRGGGGTMASTLPEEIYKTVESVRREKEGEADPDWVAGMEHMYRAVGSLTGLPTSQPIRTIKGAIAMEAGETDDPRRLIWSEYAIESRKDEDNEGISW